MPNNPNINKNLNKLPKINNLVVTFNQKASKKKSVETK